MHLFSREDCTLCGACEEVCPQKAFELFGKSPSAEEIAAEVLRDEIFLKESGGGVTFSGGEPLAQVDFCVEIAKILKEHGLHLAIDTCGAVPREAIQKILPYADRFLYDLKAIDELLKYEKKEDGSYGAIKGAKDDILMTRAIALFIS